MSVSECDQVIRLNHPWLGVWLVVTPIRREPLFGAFPGAGYGGDAIPDKPVINLQDSESLQSLALRYAHLVEQLRWGWNEQARQPPTPRLPFDLLTLVAISFDPLFFRFVTSQSESKLHC